MSRQEEADEIIENYAKGRLPHIPSEAKAYYNKYLKPVDPFKQLYMSLIGFVSGGGSVPDEENLTRMVKKAFPDINGTRGLDEAINVITEKIKVFRKVVFDISGFESDDYPENPGLKMSLSIMLNIKSNLENVSRETKGES